MINKIMGDTHTNEIIGMKVSEAKKHLKKKDKELRVINEDDSPKMVTMDIKMTRVNVFVKDGIIINIDKLG